MSLAEKTFKNGEVIIKEGDIGRSFFLLTEGKAGVYANYGKNDLFRIAVIEEGEYFGEMAIIEEYPRSATVVAIGNVHTIEIPANEMTTFFEENPEQISELMKHLGARIKTMTDDFNESEELLKEVRKPDAGKQNESLFSKIKKHINVYQANKNQINDPNTDTIRAAMNGISGDTESFQNGAVIYSEGDPSKCMYILYSGNVGFYSDFGGSDERRTSQLSAVSCFGELEMINWDRRYATAVSEADNTRVEIIYPEDLSDMIHTSPKKVDLILRLLSYRLRKLDVDFLRNCKEITESYNK